MEDNTNTNNSKKQPTLLPANYVTLAQLRERRMKELEQQQQQQQQLQQKEKEGEIQNQNRIERGRQKVQKSRTNSTRNPIGANIQESNAVSVVVVQENENEKSEEMKNTRKKKKGKKKKEENREAWARKEEEKGAAHAPPVKSENENVPATRFERKRGMRMGYVPKVVDVAKATDQAVEIESEFGDLSTEKQSDKSERRQDRVIHGGNRESRHCEGHGNRGDRNYRENYSDNDGGNGMYRGGHRRFNREDGQRSGRHERFRRNGERDGRGSQMVWMKKGEVADDGEAAGNGKTRLAR